MEASTSHSGPACFGCSPPHAVYHFSIVTIWYLANVATVAALYRPFGSKEGAAERAREKEDRKGKGGYGEGEGRNEHAIMSALEQNPTMIEQSSHAKR